MVNSNSKEDFGDDGKVDGLDHESQSMDKVLEESSVLSREVETSRIGSTGPSSVAQGTRDRIDGCLTERLRDVLIDEGNGDLLLQQTDGKNNVLQWLQALDLQVIGACRADERLKPLLKLNVSSGVAEDRLLAYLSRHFEVPEVGMLARCLCIPLVSICVGKVIKQGTLLCPTATRGNLNIILLPSSNMHISFVGDDGRTERLATLSSDSESSAVIIEEIPADKSGRSFLVKLPCGQISYFWCSEKSMLLGFELLAKMKDLLGRKTSLAQLTGISESRLDCFASHLRAYLLGSTINNSRVSPTVSSSDNACDPLEWDSNTQVSNSSSKPFSSRYISGQAKPHYLHPSSLSPRSNSFKDGAPRNYSSIRSGAREKFRRRGDSHCSFSADNLPAGSISVSKVSGSSQTENDTPPEVSGSQSLSPLSFLESLGKSVFPPSLNMSVRRPSSLVPTSGSSLFSPDYCWYPPCTSTLQYAATPQHLPITSTESVCLPPLSSLLSAARSLSSSSLIAPKLLPLNLATVPSLGFPAFLPEPLARVPLPISSFVTVPSLQQTSTFTPLMCDPIVHIPVIDFCSSVQGYLVSAGPAISTTIPPLHPNLVNPFIPEAQSVVEEGGRETLRLLLSSTQTTPQLMKVVPSVLTRTNEKTSTIVGSWGHDSGTRDVEAITNCIAAMGVVSLSHRAVGGDVSNPENKSEGTGDKEGSRFLDDVDYEC